MFRVLGEVVENFGNGMNINICSERQAAWI